MPIFLTRDQVYRILQRESPPDDVYPDGSVSGFFSTADQASVAKNISDAYSSLGSIYSNYFPTEAVEKLSDFEFRQFGYTLDPTLGIEARRALVLKKIRTRIRPTEQDLLSLIYTILPSTILVEIVPWGCGEAGWVLDVSELDISTILFEFNGLEKTGPNLCTLTAADYGLTPDEFARLQEQAYTYEVRVYGYTLTAAERAAIDQLLLVNEPARSQHIILDGLDPADAISGGT